MLEANIDDMSPQHYELATERLFAAGALDVWLTPITMKKGRPAIALSAMAAPRDEYAVARAMLTRDDDDRRARAHGAPPRPAARARDGGNAVRHRARQARRRRTASARTRAEYDDLLRIARERNLPLPEVARVVDASIQGELST